ncbi:MAG: carboxypeptidase regulatory-like domain-containing protein [Syntrophaceae bacterium]
MTGKDGTFTIPDVPPGNYTLVVWQEHAGSREIPVAVKSRETVTVPAIELK